MKHFALLMLLVAASFPVFSQITLVSTDVPAVPSTAYNAIDTLAAGLSLGQNGANRTWNFATAVRHKTDTVRHKLPSSTSYASTYPTATDAITVDNVNYAFFKNSSTKLECLGLAGDLLNNGSSLSVTFNPVLDVFRYPVTYNDKFSSSYGFFKQVSGSSVGQPLVNQIRVTFTATFYDTIDAWGTLTTPVGTYQTIREKRVEYNRTLVEAQPFFPANWSTVSDTRDTVITYTWLSKDTKGAVLTANVSKTTGAITKVTYSLTPPAAAPPVANFTWANPYGGFVQFTNTSTNNPTSYAWTFGDGGTSTAANPSHTYAANGPYTVCLTATNTGGSHQYCTTVTVSGIFNTAITGSTQLCSNARTGIAYSATSRPGNTYSWTATGGTVASGAGTAAVTVNWNATGPYNLRLIECNSTGQFCDTANVAITVKTAPTTTVNQTICYGQSYLGYNASGTYTNTYTAANGCDSVRTLNLTVRPANTTTVNMSICAGGNYLGHTTSGQYVDTYQGANGCDSVRTLNLTVRPANTTTVNASICPGSNYAGHTTSGTFVDHYTDVNGCDSARTLNLTVQPSIIDTLTLSLCNGNSYQGYNTTGTYNDTFSVGQCDSIRVLKLTILHEIFDTITASICQGDNYAGYTTEGSYTNTFTSSGGCDSTRTLHLTVLQPVTTTINQTVCAGGNYQGYTASGTYSDIFTAANGCDSTRTLNLTVRPQNVTSISVSICNGGSYAGHTTAGIYTDTYTDVNGCDSIRTLNLTLVTVINTSVQQTLCFGENYQGYDVSGVYIDTFSAGGGCDSIRTLSLTVDTLLTSLELATICQGESYNGYTTGGTYIDTLQSILGCDSIHTLKLDVNPLPGVSAISATGNVLSIADSFASYQWYLDGNLLNGEDEATLTATANGNYTVVVTNVEGCEETSASFNVTGIGIDETLAKWGVKCYPNPANNVVYLQLDGAGEARYTVYNSLGQSLVSGDIKGSATIDLSGFAEGIYYVKAVVNGSVSINRIIKQ